MDLTKIYVTYEDDSEIDVIPEQELGNDIDLDLILLEDEDA